MMKEDKDHVLSESSDASCPGPHDEADLEEPSVAAREERRLSNSPTFVAWRARVRAKAINRDKLITKKKKTGGFQLKVKMLRQDSQSCIGQRATETSGKTSEGDSYLEFSNGKRKTLASGSKPRRSPFLQRSGDHEKALRPQG